MRKLTLGISLTILTILLCGCGGSSGQGDGAQNGGTGGGTGSGTGQSESAQIQCLQNHPLLNGERLTTREEAVNAFYRAAVYCNASLGSLVKKAKAMEQNGTYVE